VRENGRIVVMLCAFEGVPKIFRFHGRGEVVSPADPKFAGLAALFDHDLKGVRSIIRIAVERVSDSCGFGVPVYQFVKDRTILQDQYQTVPPEQLNAYVAENNVVSIDGLPALTPADAAATADTAE
jgi:hypothetical protein